MWKLAADGELAKVLDEETLKAFLEAPEETAKEIDPAARAVLYQRAG